MKKKVVINVSMDCQRSRPTALQVAVGVSGVESAALVGEDKSQLEVIGDGVDPVLLTRLLRESVGHAEVVSVSAVGEKKEENIPQRGRVKNRIIQSIGEIFQQKASSYGELKREKKPEEKKLEEVRLQQFLSPYGAEKKEGENPEEKTLEENFRSELPVSKAALQHVGGVSPSDYTVPAEVKAAGFEICANELGFIVEGHDVKKLEFHGGVEGIAQKLSTSTANGLSTQYDTLKSRQKIFGVNKFVEKKGQNFWTLLWEDLQDMTLMILGGCAFVSYIVSKATEQWPKGAHDGQGVVASILLVVLFTATRDYCQALLFRDVDKEKKKISIQVTRNGFRQKLSTNDLLPGDIVHLAIGDQVPADGLFVSGFSVLVDQSSLTGKNEPVMVNSENPYMLSGTKVRYGSCKMMVSAVGMRTQWSRFIATLSEEGDDETPLQVKLNGVATLIGKIALAFAVVSFAVLVQSVVSRKWRKGFHGSWAGDDVLELLEYFAVAVTIIVVAVPEGLPLAVTLSLALTMKKMINDKALVQHLAACETMGLATTICCDKTGKLTTNNMTVVKSCICMNITELGQPKNAARLGCGLPDYAVKLLQQSIFNNTGGEVVVSEDGKLEMVGTPTESAILEFGLSLGGDFEAERQAVELIKVEPFNSERKQMRVVVELPEGGLRAHTIGASEIVLSACDKVINSNGEVVLLDEATINHFKFIVDQFASEALRTPCLAYMDLERGFSPENPIPVSGYTCIGILGIKDPIRPGVKESVAVCRSAGITVRMVTGDSINTAKAVARECGILTDDGIAIEGPDFREKKPEEMLQLIPKIQVMAQSSPLDKHTLVKRLQTLLGEVVAVTGDGTNDALALHDADIGLGMGITGTELAKESADIIILDDDFSTIVTVAKWGRSVYINIQKLVQFQLTVIVVILIVSLSSACLTGNTPFTAVQLLWINMIVDTLGALAFATEPPNNELMARPPVGRKGTFFSNIMWRNILGQSLYQFIVIWYLQTKGKTTFNLDGPDSDLVLNTLILNSFIFCQVFNGINSREMEGINVFKGMLDNHVFVAVLCCVVLFQIIIVEFLSTFSNTTPLMLSQWFITVLLGFLGMPVAAVLKMIPV